jgi:hypothetical protein
MPDQQAQTSVSDATTANPMFTPQGLGGSPATVNLTIVFDGHGSIASGLDVAAKSGAG